MPIQSTRVDSRQAERVVLTVAQAATQLMLSQRTVWRLIGLGELKTVRCGRSVRITVASFDEFVLRGGTSK